MPPIATTDNPHLPFFSCLILLLSPHLGRHILLNHMPCLKGHQVSFHRSTTLCAIPDVIFTVVPTKQQRQLNLSPDYVSLWVAKIISFCLPLFSSFNISKHSPLNIPPNRSIKEATLSQHCENPGISWAWWRTPLFPALGRQRQAVF